MATHAAIEDFVTKQASVFVEENLKNFNQMKLPKSQQYLQVVANICVNGLLRIDDCDRIQWSDVEILKDGVKISVKGGKTNTPYEFMLLFDGNQGSGAVLVKDYYFSVPKDMRKGKFFKVFRQSKVENSNIEGNYIQQNLGINSLRKCPQMIAKLLNLPHPESFTGHSFRRTGATMFANHGCSTKQLKALGRWKSEDVADRYIEHSTDFIKKNAEIMQNIGDVEPPRKKRRIGDGFNVEGSTVNFNFYGSGELPPLESLMFNKEVLEKSNKKKK